MVPRLHELYGTTRLHETCSDNPIIDDNTIVGTKVDATPDQTMLDLRCDDYNER
jgi:hypothetical protein